jgi:hypothetical protein
MPGGARSTITEVACRSIRRWTSRCNRLHQTLQLLFYRFLYSIRSYRHFILLLKPINSTLEG